jgi:Domain of unknown function (DUF1287)
MVFFSRKGESLPISANATDYHPGELVTWDLGGGVPHIGIIVDKKSASGLYPHRPQHRPGTKSRRRPPQLEDHRSLPLLRPGRIISWL